ncbi:MAG: YkgJ family cysteine cluster protein [Verrucomicrobiales bacterium]|tara:strand:+ start:2107 stop:2427 length:321 start_codon:yes stop_codon:yes gene_type:complete
MIHFKCDRCTNCCNWPGEVVVTDVEIDLMAKQLDISPQIFIEKYTDLRENRNGLTLKNNENGSCVLLKNRNCSVHSKKPNQCRDFPNNWRFKGWRQICEALPSKIK